MTDKEPERYYDWMLWKNRQEEAKRQKLEEEKYFDKKWEEHKRMLELHSQIAKIYESPDGGKTVYERDFGQDPSERRLVTEDFKLEPSDYFDSGIDYRYNEAKLIDDFKKYVDSTYGEHYSKEKFQATEFIIDGGHGTGFCIGNVLKYAQRYGKKGSREDARKDLMKVLHYALMQLYVHDNEL